MENMGHSFARPNYLTNSELKDSEQRTTNN